MIFLGPEQPSCRSNRRFRERVCIEGFLAPVYPESHASRGSTQLSRRWQCLKCGSDVDNAVPKPLEKLREDLSARAEHFEKAVSLMRIGRDGKPA
jgi:hypothetical protein